MTLIINRHIKILFIFLILTTLTGCSYGNKGLKEYSLGNARITVEDLKNFLGIEIYKYIFYCQESAKINIVFENYENKRNIFKVSHDVNKNDEVTILILFQKLDDTIGSALNSKNEEINYSVLLNAYSPAASTLSMFKSGTIDNINYNHSLTYSEIPVFTEGNLKTGKRTLRKFYTYTEETETFIGEIYLEVE